MEIRAAKKSDVIDIYGKNFEQSMRAVVVEHDGVVMGIAGIIHSSPMQCISIIRDIRLRKSPKTIVKVAKRLRTMLDSYDVEIYAVANKDELDAPKFLEFVGFEHFDKEVYKWPPH